MENILSSYLNKRLKEIEISQKTKREHGPVITISREVGCNGLFIANQISQRLNKQFNGARWKVISKEVFSESARELNLEPEKVRHILKRTDKYTFDEILEAFNNRNFKSERIVVKSVINTIRSYAIAGFCIIVGRAGHLIAKDIKNAFHLRLYAPLDYRIQSIMERNKLQHDEALLFIQKVEKERIAFRKAIKTEIVDDDFFDLYVNRASFGDEAIIDIIEQAIEKKRILENNYFKMQYF